MVDTEEKLAAFLSRLRTAEWVALDTEADSLHAYPEKMCLLQIGTAAGEELLDPLAGMDLAPLLAALAPHELIMHGADYDLRLLRKHHHFAPRAVFDTMLAARLLGHRQFGLTHLVAQYLGIALEKGPQKANWARRPLTERMEHYALNDARYLKPLADRLRTELEAKGRLAWHGEWCVQFLAENTQPVHPDLDSEWRIKGSHALSRPALAVLRELWKWREREAIAANRPPFFILSHEALVALATHAAAARPFRHLVPDRFSDRRRAALLRAIEQGLAVPPAAQPEIFKPVQRRPTHAEMRRFRELEGRRDARAAQLHLDPTVIASRSTLSQLAQDWHAHAPELLHWQRELLL